MSLFFQMPKETTRHFRIAKEAASHCDLKRLRPENVIRNMNNSFESATRAFKDSVMFILVPFVDQMKLRQKTVYVPFRYKFRDGLSV